MGSWAPSTQRSYNSCIKRWIGYCKANTIRDPYNASYKEGMSFLADLFYKENQKYGLIAVARSALSTILPRKEGKTFGKDETVSRMIRGIFKLRPSLPKYVSTYDPDVILRYISNLPSNRELMLEMLTKKLCTLLCLLSGQRAQSIQVLKISKSVFSHDTYAFYIDKVIKTSKPGNHQKPLEYRMFPGNKKSLCGKLHSRICQPG